MRERDEARALWRRLHRAPRLSDRDLADRRLADLMEALAPDVAALVAMPRVRRLVAAIADHSPYLRQLVEADADRLARLLRDPPSARLDAILAALEVTPDGEDEAGIMRRLRRAKQEVALLVAFADLGGVWGLEATVGALSRAADALIGAALAHLLRRAAAAGELRLADPDRPQAGCGLAVLGLGKLGGDELNYSSDVDLVVVFDPDSAAIVDRDCAKPVFVRIVQGLVRLLQQPTADGMALRVDLRLRPDPGSSAAAMAVGAAFLYYEAYGQNWERAALIKARPVAGDGVVARAFLDGLVPFIWRRYFDYASIADIHAMKRQIHAVKGHGAIAVAGHNVKLGRGGIREIEFFVQTQQLIFGGRRKDLRGRRTLPMLRRLRRDGWIGARAVGELARAYAMLRRVEHRLQMIADAQTHLLPSEPPALERFARFCGFASAERFGAVLTRHLRKVVRHYALLFETAPALDDAGGSLVFTGVADDAETIETLAALGYAEPAVVVRRVREWHAGQRLAVRSPRARETLTDLVPKLLVTFARTHDPDAAVAAFDEVIARMPAGGETFALLDANATLRTLFGDILGSAPRLASAVALRPHLLDVAIDPASAVCLDADALAARLAAPLALATTTEDVLDRLRELFREEHFLICVRLLSGDLDPDDAALAFSALAAAIIAAALGHARAVFAREHGEIAGGRVVVLAMGKLGSREMTATSDLDLVLVYDVETEAPVSNGPKPLHATAYFARLAQRLVGYLTVATRRGGLYAVDMRLRPSGNQGPLATRLSAFAAYQREAAATWEHMALTRARVVAGDRDLADRLTREIADVLRRPPPPGLGADIVAMRALIAKEKPPRGALDLKLAPGGLVDLEFIAQYLVLRHAAEEPGLVDPSTRAVLARATAAGFVDASSGDRLIEAHRLLSGAQQVMRLALDEVEVPDRAGAGVLRRLAEVAGLPDVERLLQSLDDARQAVRDIFDAVVAAS